MFFENVIIAYFSGTGNAAKVAEEFRSNFVMRNHQATKYALVRGANPPSTQADLLIIIYAVHALNAPLPVYEWIEKLPQNNSIPAVVISVSGGGEVCPNTACRSSVIRRLQKKGYHVFYEKMLVMPSNFVVQTQEPIALKLLEVLGERVELIVNDVVSGVMHRTKPLFIDRCLSVVGELEKKGAIFFGRSIKANAGCNGCGWCADNCPGLNIKMKAHKPAFSNQCLLCLRCIYGCPNKALAPSFLKFVVLKRGFHLQELDKKVPSKEPVDIEGLTKGAIWKGVREYLRENMGEKG